MKIICTGLSRTGTKSLAAALRSLGLIVHDYVENLHYHLDEYYEAIDAGKMPNFYEMYKDVDAAIAFPVYMYWKELKETFPNAKVILVERDNTTSWARSYLSMKVATFASMATLWNRLGMTLTPTGRKWKKVYFQSYKWFNITRFFSRLPLYQYFYLSDGEIEEIEKNVSQVYNDHNSRVKATIPREDLLVYNVKQGWKPLCEFLGVDIPDVPFPRLNAGSQSIHALTSRCLLGNPKVFYELVFILTVLVAFAAFGIFLIYSFSMQ